MKKLSLKALIKMTFRRLFSSIINRNKKQSVEI